MAQQSTGASCNFATDLVDVIDHEGKSVSVDAFTGEGKYLGLYFSAHWCPPCRAFTPQLASFYERVKKAGKNLEIIFVSSDRDEANFKDYFGSMPWLALSFGNRDAKENLCKTFNVRGIPMFVLLNGKTGEVLIENARGHVGSDLEGETFPWGK